MSYIVRSFIDSDTHGRILFDVDRSDLNETGDCPVYVEGFGFAELPIEDRAKIVDILKLKFLEYAMSTPSEFMDKATNRQEDPDGDDWAERSEIAKWLLEKGKEEARKLK